MSGCQRIVAVRDIATEALSASLESLLTSDIPVKKKKLIHIVSGAKFAAKLRFHQTARSQNHRCRVPNPSRATIAAAQPLKHVETRKNVVLNSTKTKDFCRICPIENHPHAQKLFVIIVASGIECSVIVLCAHNWIYGSWWWRSELAVFVEAVYGRREWEARKSISGAVRGSPGRPVQAGIMGKRLRIHVGASNVVIRGERVIKHYCFSGQSMPLPGLLNLWLPKIPTWTPWGGVGLFFIDFLGSSWHFSDFWIFDPLKSPWGRVGLIFLGSYQSHIYPNMCAKFDCGPTVVNAMLELTIAKCSKTAASSNDSNHLSRTPAAWFASGTAHHGRPYRNLGS